MSGNKRIKEKRTVRRAGPGTLVSVLVLTVVLGVTLAQAEITQKGNLRVTVTAQLRPHRLPRTGAAPVSVSVGGQITTVDEDQPPQLRALSIELNRHGRLDDTGLPICNIHQIQPASSGRALANCHTSLVGQGRFFGTITLPGTAPYAIEGPLLVFNGRRHGQPVLLGHIFSAQPFATSFVIPFEIASHPHGDYGTTLTANVSRALGTKRNLTGIEMTLSRRYSYRGEHRSFVSAGCPAPKGIGLVPFPLARTTFTFAGGARISSVLSRTCAAR